MRAGTAVGRGRALVEHVHRGVVAPFEALLEDAVLFPEREDAGVERGEVDARDSLAEPGLLVAHGTRFRRAAGRRADSTRHGRPGSQGVSGCQGAAYDPHTVPVACGSCAPPHGLNLPARSTASFGPTRTLTTSSGLRLGLSRRLVWGPIVQIGKIRNGFLSYRFAIWRPAASPVSSLSRLCRRLRDPGPRREREPNRAESCLLYTSPSPRD